MSCIVINIVTDDISASTPPPVNFEIVEFQECVPAFNKVNQNIVRLLANVDLLHKTAANNGGNILNSFLTSNSSAVVPKRDLRSLQTQILSKIEHFKSVDNVRYTCTGSIILSIFICNRYV